MSGLTGRERLQPSLLDRLTDDARTSKRDGPDQQALTVAQLRQAVLRDLSNLLNTTNLAAVEPLDDVPLVAKSTVNYGIPGLAGLLSSAREIRTLEERMTEAVRNFEPRIRAETVRVHARGATEEFGLRALLFEIEGELWAQPVPIQLFVETRIDVETRVAVVTEGRSRAADGS